MKTLTTHVFDAANCRREWLEFRSLLTTKGTLSERDDVLPFFRARLDLSMLIATYFPLIATPGVIAHEYQIDGDFAADLVVGDRTKHQYLLVEFENGAHDSIFKKTRKATANWAPRMEGAYSQITDWLWKLEDKRPTADFEHDFGNRQAKFHGLIVIGKDVKLSDQDRHRLKWRMDHTFVHSTAISVCTFDELLEDLGHWLTRFYGV